MNYQMMDLWFIHTVEEQHIGLTHSGNQYYIDIYAKNDEFRLKDNSLDAVCSGMFDSLDEAMKTFTKFVDEFGRGNFSWEQRKAMVRNAGKPRNR